jgi:hypothetical protein
MSGFFGSGGGSTSPRGLPTSDLANAQSYRPRTIVDPEDVGPGALGVRGHELDTMARTGDQTGLSDSNVPTTVPA